jgi:hypothetical protein
VIEGYRDGNMALIISISGVSLGIASDGSDQLTVSLVDQSDPVKGFS